MGEACLRFWWCASDIVPSISVPKYIIQEVEGIYIETASQGHSRIISSKRIGAADVLSSLRRPKPCGIL